MTFRKYFALYLLSKYFLSCADPMSESRRSLIVCGMHRSYTSLTANALHKSGLFLGKNLIGASPGNPYGHFESQEIFEFHRAAIKNEKLSSFWSYVDYAKAGRVADSKAWKEQAAEILEDHFDKVQFGWKDPMSALFIKGWQSVLPDAHYIIVVRHPVEVVRSLITRSMRDQSIKYRPFMTHRWMNLWDNTYRALLKLSDQYPTRCFFVEGPGDFFNEKKLNELNRVVLDLWNFDLAEIQFKNIIDERLLKEKPANHLISSTFKLRRRSNRLYKALQEKSENQPTLKLL